MTLDNALSKKQTTTINGFMVILVFLSHFGQYEHMPWDFLMLGIGQMMVAPFLFYSGYGIMEQIRNKPQYIEEMPKKKILKLYMRFWIAVELYWMLSVILHKNYPISRIILSFLGWSSVGNSNWYIFAIIALYWITYISFKYCKDREILACFSLTILYIVLMMIFKREDWWYNTVLCFPAGMFLSKHKAKFELWLSDPNVYSFEILLIFGLYILGLKAFSYNVLCIVLCQLAVSLCRHKSVESKIGCFLGGYVFEVYILQRIPMIILQNHIYGYAYLVLCAVITLGLAVAFKRLESKIDKHI